MMFCHLHVHDEYSLLDGCGKTKSFVQEAKRLGHSHLAITNHANIDGALRLQSEAKKAGISPIFGGELYVVPDLEKKSSERFHLTVLVKDETGFQNLCKMLSIANLRGFYYRPRIDFDSVLELSKGLVFLTGCAASPLSNIQGQIFIGRLAEKNPGNVYLEVMPHLLENQNKINKICLDISNTIGIELVATNDCHYVQEEQSELQEVLLAIQTKKIWSDPTRFRFSINGLHMRSEQEMKEAFVKQGILSKGQCLMAIKNTLEIAQKCGSFTINRKDIWLPPVAGISESLEEEKILSLCRNRYRRIFGEGKWKKEYFSRLEEEFALIKKKKFLRYFLLVYELVEWCRKEGIMVGPGRGSVGGSLIAYLMGITKIDPIVHGLLFSRFIDEERIDYPDIDLDFEDIKRPLIREHLESLYGKKRVSSISTFMTMKGRGVIRDVARVFDIPLREVDEFAKTIVEEEGNAGDTIGTATKSSPVGISFSSRYPKVISFASQLEGQIRGCSQHAAGIVVSGEDLTEGTRGNLCIRSNQEVINWDKDDAEYLGLMKLDILGLNTMTVLNETKRLIKQNHGKEIQFEKISLDNPQIFESLSRGETIGVFQFNTWSVTKMTKETGVENFGQMGDILALVRPGPLDSGMTEDFIKRKHGTKWKKKHAIYEDITKDTYGIIVYQEQLMQVINLVAGLSYTIADKIRKIVSKKRDVKEFEKYKGMFIDGCFKQNTLSKKEAEEFWEALESHARYSFNKSHSYEYAMIAYWCAWCKLYFPGEFIAANLTYGSDGKKEELLKEAVRIGLKVVFPRIGLSHPTQWVVNDGNIYVPFIEIKGVGEKTVIEIANYKPKKEQGFFSSVKKEPGKIEKIIEDIGALGDTPKGDLQKYFKFDISSILINQDESTRIIIFPNKWRNPELTYCKDCELRRYAKRPVLPSCGIYNIGIFGEAPERMEDEQGKGFVGKSGDLLWNELWKHELTRRQFHVSNICHCWPGDIKTPRLEHIQACSKWVDEEIKNTKMKLCLALGNTSLKYFKGQEEGIMRHCGTTEWISSKGIWVCWGLHPSAVLRNPSNRKLFDDGIRNFADKIKSSGGIR